MKVIFSREEVEKLCVDAASKFFTAEQIPIDKELGAFSINSNDLVCLEADFVFVEVHPVSKEQE